VPLIYVDRATGLHRASRSDLRSYLESSLKGIYGAGIDLSPATQDGQLVDALTDVYDELLSVVVQIYSARSPTGATGAALARLVKINGVTKKGPAHSTGVVTLTSAATSPDVPVPAGARIGNSHPGVSATFETTEDVTIPGGGGTVDVDVRSTVTGPVRGNAHELTNIITAIPGWAMADNASAVVLGDDGETDAKLRARRAASVALPSQGIVDGLRGALLQLPDVKECIVRENPEDTIQTLPDGGALAPHAVQVIIRGGADPKAIAETIWIKKSSGVTLVGATTYDVKDSRDKTHTMKWDTPAEVPIYVTVHTAAPLASAAQDEISQAIANLGGGTFTLNGAPLPGSLIGEDVSVSDVFIAITALSATTQPDLKVSEIDIGLTANPTTTAPVAIAFNEIATWDPANVSFASP
jgi:uncharacterized phage protein gp47/JayE